MRKAVVFFVVIAIGILMVLGCSQTSPVDLQPQPALERSNDLDGHVLWGYYRFHIDPAGPTAEVAPLRQVERHFNVKPFVNPPKCYDCILIQPTGPYQNFILPLNITLKNPELITGYDVRGILLNDDANSYYLDNPDNYTSLYDDGGLININPFKAYAKSETNRAFGSGASFMEHYDLYLSAFNKVAIIDYAVDASWPTRAKEPYEARFSYSSGELDSLGLETIVIGIKANAAGGDVDEVLLDCSSLGFSEDIILVEKTHPYWEASFENTPLAVPGDYVCLLKASTASSTKYLYDYITVTVVEGTNPTSLQDDIQPIYNTYCISCHQSPAPPLDLDLTSGNAYSNTVNIDSEQSFLKLIFPGQNLNSYLFGKIIGAHQDFPYFGSGDRMPKNGPPYLTEGEILTVSGWIAEGALNN